MLEYRFIDWLFYNDENVERNFYRVMFILMPLERWKPMIKLYSRGYSKNLFDVCKLSVNLWYQGAVDEAKLKFKVK